MKLSGTWLLRASLISRRSTGFLSGSKQSSPEPSQLTQAFITALRCFWLILEPVTSAATFCSSTTFQLMYCSMSGWSTSTTTILAARRVVPPDLIAPAARSPIFRKLIRPDARQLLVLAAQPREVRAGARAVLEQARLAHPQVHDAALVDEVVLDALDEAGMRLRMLVGRLGLCELAGLPVDVIVALAGTVDA